MIQTRQIVVIGTSSGGIEALRQLVRALPRDFGPAIALVMHIPPASPGILAEILNVSGPLPARTPRDLERIEPGHIYVAPADRHLLVEPGRLRLTRGPRENRFRPAVDPLFRSAAQTYGPGAVGIILSGNLDDGSAGLWAIKRLGGTAIVQEPGEAPFPEMPRNAIATADVDYIVPLAEIPPLLVRLTAAELRDGHAESVPAAMDVEIKVAKEEDPLQVGLERVAALRAVQEAEIFLDRVAGQTQGHHRLHGDSPFTARASELRRQAETLRTMLTSPADSLNRTNGEPTLAGRPADATD